METFASVTKINTIWVLLYLAVNSNVLLYQLVFKNVFQNRDLEDEAFMSLPPGFEERLGKNKVCRLKKSLYGIKQSLRAWFERFRKAVRHHGYYQSEANHTMFINIQEKVKLLS